MNFALLAAITMSAAKAILAPAPAATPFTAHTTGFGRLISLRISGLYRFSSDSPRSTPSPPGATARSDKSCPAQNPRPAPVISSARISGSSSALDSACATSSCICTVKLLRRSGRLSVSFAAPLLTSNRMVSYAIATTSNRRTLRPLGRSLGYSDDTSSANDRRRAGAPGGRASPVARRYRTGLGNRNRGGARRLCAHRDDGAQGHAQRPRDCPWRDDLCAGGYGLRLRLQFPEYLDRGPAGLDRVPDPGEGRRPARGRGGGTGAGRPLARLLGNGPYGGRPEDRDFSGACAKPERAGAAAELIDRSVGYCRIERGGKADVHDGTQ